MSLNPSRGAQICPHCGAPNSALSIFCAECGTSLTAARSDDDQESPGQTTVSFTPVHEDADPGAAAWDTASDTQTTQEFTPHAMDAASSTDEASYAWQEDTYAAPYPPRPPESRRGFVLGLIAAILIVIVIGFFVWSTILSEGIRDSITGIF